MRKNKKDMTPAEEGYKASMYPIIALFAFMFTICVVAGSISMVYKNKQVQKTEYTKVSANVYEYIDPKTGTCYLTRGRNSGAFTLRYNKRIEVNNYVRINRKIQYGKSVYG